MKSMWISTDVCAHNSSLLHLCTVFSTVSRGICSPFWNITKVTSLIPNCWLEEERTDCCLIRSSCISRLFLFQTVSRITMSGDCSFSHLMYLSPSPGEGEHLFDVPADTKELPKRERAHATKRSVPTRWFGVIACYL